MLKNVNMYRYFEISVSRITIVHFEILEVDYTWIWLLYIYTSL